MPRSKEISDELRKKVVEAHEAGKGYKTISKVFDLHRSTVRQIVHKWRVFNTTATRPRSGRPTKIDTILRKVRRSGAGSQNGEITSEGGDRDKEETACISDNENELEDGSEVDGSSEGEETERISGSKNQRTRKDVSGGAEGGEGAQGSGEDTSPESAGVQDDVPASINPLRPNDPSGTRTRPKTIRGRKEKTKDVGLMCNRVLASPPTHSSRRAPASGAAEHHMEVMLCCEICDACFPTEADLESHQAQHLVKILHECEECGKAFQSAAILKTHKKKKTWLLSVHCAPGE